MIICIRLLSYSSTILFVCLIDWLFVCLFCFWVSQSAAYCMPSVWSVWFNKSLKFVLKTVKRTKGQHLPSTCCLNSKKMFRHGLFKFKNTCEEDKGSPYTINSMPNGVQVPRSSTSLRLSFGIENMDEFHSWKIETLKNLWTGHQTQSRQKDATWGWVKTLVPSEPQVIAGIYGCE